MCFVLSKCYHLNYFSTKMKEKTGYPDKIITKTFGGLKIITNFALCD